MIEIDMPPGSVMVDQVTCTLAGASMARSLHMANPDMQFTWRCTPEEEA